MGKRSMQQGTAVASEPVVKKGKKPRGEAPRSKQQSVASPTKMQTPTKAPAKASFVGERRFPLADCSFDDDRFHGALHVRRSMENPATWCLRFCYQGQPLHPCWEKPVEKLRSHGKYGSEHFQVASSTSDGRFTVAMECGVSPGIKMGGTCIAAGIPTILLLLTKAGTSDRVLLIVVCTPEVGIERHQLSTAAGTLNVQFDEKALATFGATYLR